MTGVFLSVPRYDWCAPLSHPSSCMLVNYGPSQQSSKEEYKPWKWGATARYYASHTQTMLPTKNSEPRSNRRSDHTKTSCVLEPQTNKTFAHSSFIAMQTHGVKGILQEKSTLAFTVHQGCHCTHTCSCLSFFLSFFFCHNFVIVSFISLKFYDFVNEMPRYRYAKFCVIVAKIYCKQTTKLTFLSVHRGCNFTNILK